MGTAARVGQRMSRSIANEMTQEISREMAKAQKDARSISGLLLQKISEAPTAMLSNVREQMRAIKSLMTERRNIARERFAPLGAGASEAEQQIRKDKLLARAYARGWLEEVRSAWPQMRATLKQRQDIFEADNKNRMASDARNIKNQAQSAAAAQVQADAIFRANRILARRTQTIVGTTADIIAQQTGIAKAPAISEMRRFYEQQSIAAADAALAAQAAARLKVQRRYTTTVVAGTADIIAQQTGIAKAPDIARMRQFYQQQQQAAVQARIDAQRTAQRSLDAQRSRALTVEFTRREREIQQGARPLINFQQELYRTFAGRGILALSAGLFAPLGVAMRGLKDITDATRTAFISLGGVLQGRIFGIIPGIVRATGTMFRGLMGIVASTTDMVGRLIAFAIKIPAMIPGLGNIPGLGKIIDIFPKIGDMIGALSGINSELINVLGKIGGLVGEAAAGIITPLTSILDMAISPLTTAIGLLSMAWRFSLVAMTGATIAFVKTATSTFVNFERSISAVIAQIVNVGWHIPARFRDISLGLSRELGKSAMEINSALRLAVSVGFEDIAQATEVARHSIRLATASFGDIKTATEALTNVMNSYGKSAREAGPVSDLLFRGWQVAGGEMDDFAQGLGTISASIHAIGGSMKDLVGISALLSQSSAGNTRIFRELQQAFEQVITPRGNVNPLAMLGLQLQRTNDGGVDFVKTLTDIQKRVEQLSGGDVIRRGQIIRSMFPESREFRAIARFFGSTKENIQRTFEAVAAPAGAIQKQLDQMGGTMFRQIEIMKAAWERLKISFGGVAATFFLPLVKGAESFFDRIFLLIESGRFGKMRESFSKIFTAMGAGPGVPFADVLINFFADRLPEAIDNTIDKVRQISIHVRTFLAAFDFEIIQDGFYLVLANILDALDKTIGPIAESIPNAISKAMDDVLPLIESAIEKWGPTIISAFQKIAPQIAKIGYEIGFTVGKGIVSGMWNAQPFHFGARTVRPEDLPGMRIQMGLEDLPGGEPGMRIPPVQNRQIGGIVSGTGVGDTVLAHVRGTKQFVMLEPGEEILPRRDPRHIRNIHGMQLGGLADKLREGVETRAGFRGSEANDVIVKVRPQIDRLHDDKNISDEIYNSFIDAEAKFRAAKGESPQDLFYKSILAKAAARRGLEITGMSAWEVHTLPLPMLPPETNESLRDRYLKMSPAERTRFIAKGGAAPRQLAEAMHAQRVIERKGITFPGGIGARPMSAAVTKQFEQQDIRTKVHAAAADPLNSVAGTTAYDAAMFGPNGALARGLIGRGAEAFAMRAAKEAAVAEAQGRVGGALGGLPASGGGFISGPLGEKRLLERPAGAARFGKERGMFISGPEGEMTRRPKLTLDEEIDRFNMLNDISRAFQGTPFALGAMRGFVDNIPKPAMRIKGTGGEMTRSVGLTEEQQTDLELKKAFTRATIAGPEGTMTREFDTDRTGFTTRGPGTGAAIPSTTPSLPLGPGFGGGGKLPLGPGYEEMARQRGELKDVPPIQYIGTGGRGIAPLGSQRFRTQAAEREQARRVGGGRNAPLPVRAGGGFPEVPGGPFPSPIIPRVRGETPAMALERSTMESAALMGPFGGGVPMIPGHFMMPGLDPEDVKRKFGILPKSPALTGGRMSSGKPLEAVQREGYLGTLNQSGLTPGSQRGSFGGGRVSDLDISPETQPQFGGTSPFMPMGAPQASMNSMSKSASDLAGESSETKGGVSQAVSDVGGYLGTVSSDLRSMKAEMARLSAQVQVLRSGAVA